MTSDRISFLKQFSEILRKQEATRELRSCPESLLVFEGSKRKQGTQTWKQDTYDGTLCGHGQRAYPSFNCLIHEWSLSMGN